MSMSVINSHRPVHAYRKLPEFAILNDDTFEKLLFLKLNRLLSFRSRSFSNVSSLRRFLLSHQPQWNLLYY